MFKRPNNALGLYSRAALLRSPIEMCETVTMTAPAATAALPQSAASNVQEYSSVDRTPIAVVCSGTIVQTGDTLGVLFEDAQVSTSATYITQAPNMLFQITAADVASITVGVDVYMVVSTMRITHTASTNPYIGKVVGAVETNPAGLPAGLYAPIYFKQSQL